LKKPSKAEFEETFNKLLGTSIKWSLLRYEDLVELAVLFNNPDVLLKKLGIEAEREMVRRRLVDVGLDAVREFTQDWQGPLARILRRILAEERR
jgi:hypothetical protein